MKKRRTLIRGIAAAGAMLVMILDSKTAAASARDGVELCIRTVIPSLFPFFVLSGVINSCLFGQNFGLLQPLARITKIPKGSESLLLLSFLAGYPIGAQLIAQSYRAGNLSIKTAKRMLGFCNNAGPAFLFGILSPLFTNMGILWLLWGIHIFSAIVTGWLLPDEEHEMCHIPPKTPITISQSLYNAIKAMASVCGWIVLFRVVLGFCNRWFLWIFPAEVQVLFTGLLELANGCILLQNIPQAGMRFLLAGIVLSFGGLCVGMQTMSVTEDLGTGWYFPGKVLQTALTILFAYILQSIIFVGSDRVPIDPTVIILVTTILLVFIFVIHRNKAIIFRKGVIKDIFS